MIGRTIYGLLFQSSLFKLIHWSIKHISLLSLVLLVNLVKGIYLIWKPKISLESPLSTQISANPRSASKSAKRHALLTRPAKSALKL